ncbi:MAG: hypothetical protein RI967_2565 [Planctomycetota bacterium]
MAIASLALGTMSAALFCCGLGIAGPLAILLGMFALRQIAASDGALRGRWFAWTGIALGLVGLVLTLVAQWAVQGVQERMNAELDAAVTETFAATDEGSAGDAVGRWLPAAGRRIGSADLLAFADEVRARYGAFESMSVLETETPELSLMENHRLHMAVAFRFARADAAGERTGGERVDGEVVAVLVPGMTSLLPGTRLESIVLVDPKLGALELRGRIEPREASEGGAAAGDPNAAIEEEAARP